MAWSGGEADAGSAAGPLERRSHRRLALAGALLTLLIALALFSRSSIDDELRRDEAIYAYGGQQLAEGVPPYVSILDPKTPLATMIAGAAVSTARATGIDDIHAMRLAFFLFACLAVVAVYLAGLLLFGSPLAALAGAVAFAAFRGFAIDALGGPNAKTPGITFGVLATALLIGRHWFWGGFAGSLALLVWQPLGIYVIVAIAAAWLTSDREVRLRHTLHAVAGAAIPIAVTFAYFFAAGAFGELFEGAVLLPLTGTQRVESTFFDHLQHIARTVVKGYGFSAVLFWGGMALLVGLIGSAVWQRRADLRTLSRDPLVIVILPPLLFVTAFSLVDFQGYPDVYPFLPYAALGITGGVAAGLAWLDGRGLRTAGWVLASAATLLLAAGTWAWYADVGPGARALLGQRVDATQAERIVGPQGTVYSLGNPAPLVLMQRRNPSRSIYLAAGLDAWVIEHTPGGFTGWTQEIADQDPDMVLTGGWTGETAARMRAWLRASYAPIRIGQSVVFVTPAVRDRTESSGVGKLVRYGA